MRWTFDRIKRLEDLMERCGVQMNYLRREQCDEPDPARRSAYNGRVAALARRFLALSKEARQCRREARA